MTYLLDTNVVSELRKSPARIDPRVFAWADSKDQREFYLSAITVFELSLGIEMKSRRDPRQGSLLLHWLHHDLIPSFTGRILDVSPSVAITAAHMHVPDPQPTLDAFIAATAQEHDLIVATRNEKDFRRLNVPFVNPWH